MAIRPDYVTGSLTLTSGSPNFTTSGSALQAAAVQAGDEIITRSGNVLIIASIADQNSGTLMQPCPASAAGAGQPLRIRFQPDGSRYQGAARDLIEKLASGNLEALAGLTSAADNGIMFTGPGTAGTFDLPQRGRELLSGVTDTGLSLSKAGNVQSARSIIGASRPAFRAVVPANRPIGNGYGDVDMISAPLNVGNHWNGSRFLVPENGVYSFYWQAQFTDGTNDTGYSIAWIKVNGNNSVSVVSSKLLFFFPVTVSAVLYLSAGDYVTFALENDGLSGSPGLQGTRTFATGVMIG